MQHSEWGDKTVSELAKYLKTNYPELKGFDRRGLYRMVQFYKTYALEDFVSLVVSQPQSQIGSPVVTQFESEPKNEIVAFELKADKFRPEHLGQLNFYLETLDRDVKRENENPSIGVLLCKDKDNEVVEYALNRNLSPAMVAEYQVLLPQKELLQQKLRELEI